MKTPITMTANVVNEPELRTMQDGMSICRFRVADSTRKKNSQTGEWEDVGTLFVSVTCFRNLAETAAQSLHKGMRVVVSGNLEAQYYEDRNGQKQTGYAMVADHLGVSLQGQLVQAKKTTQQQQQGGWGQQQPQQQQWGGQPAQQQQQPPANDPWSSAPQQGGWGQQQDEPPF